MNKRTLVALLGSVGILSGQSGCTSMSGLGGQSDFSCKAAPGVTCQSISGVSQNAEAGNLPFQRNANLAYGNSANRKGDREEGGQRASKYGDEDSPKKLSPKEMTAAFSGKPVREAPLILRVWLAPYEDADGDLHDQSYFYTQVHNGRWVIEANQNAIGNQFRPIRPLNRQPVAEPEGAATPGRPTTQTTGIPPGFGQPPQQVDTEFPEL